MDLGSDTISGSAAAMVADARPWQRDVACILGIPIDIVTLDDVATRISESARAGQRLFISTVNLNFVGLANRSPEFRASLLESDLCTADGIAVLSLCRLLGIRLPERVAGSDFLAALSRRSSLDRPLRVQFFGGTEDAGPRACAAVNENYSPALHCVGSHYPGFASIEDMSSAPVFDVINQTKPDFLVVSLGAQKGQAWIMRNLAAIRAPVVSHLGATINFLAGSVRRAPRLVQSLGLEWLWRIYEEPHLFRRYAQDGSQFLSLILGRAVPLRAWLQWNKWRQGEQPLEVRQARPAQGVVTLHLSGALTRAGTGRLASALQADSLDARLDAREVTFDLSGLKWIDLFGMGMLLVARREVARRGGHVALVNAGPNLRRGLSLGGLQDLLTEQRP